MTSRRADWVLGLARLISSASTIWAKTGPAWKPHSPVFWSYMLTPVMSLGSRSGVNWIRECDPDMTAAMARARAVLPVPGASSSRRWPPASMVVRARRMVGTLSSRATETPSTSPAKVWAKRVASSVLIGIGGPSGWWEAGRRGAQPVQETSSFACSVSSSWLV